MSCIVRFKEREKQLLVREPNKNINDGAFNPIINLKQIYFILVFLIKKKKLSRRKNYDYINYYFEIKSKSSCHNVKICEEVREKKKSLNVKRQTKTRMSINIIKCKNKIGNQEN